MHKLLSILLILVSFNIYAEQSIRKCILLPIKDNLGGALSYKIFNDVEQVLKNSDWCVYKSNSEIMNILSNHRSNLDNLMEDPDVLKVISEKTGAGSLIKVDVIKEVKGVQIGLKVYGDNGVDLYFKEQTDSTNDDYKVLSQIIKNWLEVYSTQIPYEGRIIGVLGSQFTIDAGKYRSLFQNNEILITRPVAKRRHPLLKEIVDWETEKIAEAKIIFATKDQSQARVKSYEGKKKIRIGDWIIQNKNIKNKSVVEKAGYDDDKDDFKFGKMGTVSLDLLLGSSSVTTENSGSIKKMSGTTYGLDFDASLWVTRKYWAEFGIKKTQSSVKGREGIGSSVENELSLSSVNILFGYKYLPLGFFNGPQIDMYGGYRKQSYGMVTQTGDGITEVSYSGITFGARGTLPLQNLYKLEIDLSFIFNPNFENLAGIYEEDDSTSSYTLKFGGRYQYAPNMTIDAFYSLDSSKASFLNPVRSIQSKVSGVSLGATYMY
jgi:hypothetical protein